ncbi:MAG: hypothetical protein R3314_05200 [Longimicrobiales bacterium]|nr:hypothetical protein [Longimicrobiales bacterium]
MSQSRSVASPDLPGEAERLLRSLAGVVNARVHASESGIDAIHIEVDDAGNAETVAGHVRSALLAGFATPITPARIHVRVADADAHVTEANQHHRLRLVQDSERDAPAPQPRQVARPAEDTSFVGRPRLVAVDLDRPEDGRVLCAVTIAFRTDVFRADAVAVDLPGAAAQAAAQATVRALTHAGLEGLELDGLREVEIAGRDYVLVALRRAQHYTRVRSGSAPITGAPERAAALATVEAARQLT